MSRADGVVLRGHVAHALIRDLAAGTQTDAALARKYGVGRSTVGDFKRRHAAEIADVRERQGEEFAGLWTAVKRNRIAEYQRDIDLLNDMIEELAAPPCPCSATDCDARIIRDPRHLLAVIKRKHAALRSVAEELGQLPNRMTLQVSGGEQPVRHEIVGIDPESV